MIDLIKRIKRDKVPDDRCIINRTYLFNDSDKSILSRLDLDEKSFENSFKVVSEYWIENIGKGKEKTYLLSAMFAIKKFLITPDDFLDAGIFLGSQTERVYGNGSYQYICEAFPSLVESKLVNGIDEILVGSEILADIGAPCDGIHIYNCGRLYTKIANELSMGKVESLNHLMQKYPTPNY